MMLPTPSGVVCAVAVAPQTPAGVVDAALPPAGPSKGYLVLGESLDGLTECDALIAVIDGDVGLHPAVVQAWQVAHDHSLPRLVAAVRTASGRADFDEITAMARRSLDQDLAVRFLPLYDDDGVHYAGVLDVLRGTVTVDGSTVAADPEHLAATADLHDEVAEVLAHAAAADEVAQAHRAGLPVALAALEAAWLAGEVPIVVATDGGLGRDLIATWLDQRIAVVEPVVVPAGVDADQDPHDEPIGIGIAPGIARIWSAPGRCEMELVRAGHAVAQLFCDVPLCRDARITTGDVLRPPGSFSVVYLPRS
jgi:hypothetical protein